MAIWFSLPLVFAFVFCLIKIAQDFMLTLSHEARRSRAEKMFAGRFIRSAIALYELRHTHQNSVNPAEYERLLDEADDLVEQYYLEIETPSPHHDKVSAFRISV